MLRGRPGAEPEPHAGLHKFDGASGGCAFLGIGVHGHRREIYRRIGDTVPPF